MNKVARSLAVGDDYTTLPQPEQDLLADYVNEGYQRFLMEHDWSFLEPLAAMTLYKDVAEDADSLITQASFIPEPPPVEGLQPNTTLISMTNTTLYPSMVGGILAIPDTSQSFTIIYVGDSLNMIVNGDASGIVDKTFTISSNGIFALPKRFGGLLGRIYFNLNDGRYCPITIRPWTQVLHKLQQSTSTGTPHICAILSREERIRLTGEFQQEPRALEQIQPHSLLVWPLPNQNYTAQFKMRVLHHVLTEDEPYPMGSPEHGLTILYAILAAGHEREDDADPQNAVTKESKYQRLLADSRRLDTEFGDTAEDMGINSDMSDDTLSYLQQRRLGNFYVLINGEIP